MNKDAPLNEYLCKYRPCVVPVHPLHKYSMDFKKPSKHKKRIEAKKPSKHKKPTDL